MTTSSTLGAYSTAEQALQGADLSGKTVLLTGGNSGIGTETARVLALAGARVILTSRRIGAGQEVADIIQKQGVKGKVVVKQLDLSDLTSVQALAADINATEPRLDLLILNAGVMACPQSYTKQDFEMQIGQFSSRIVVVSSLAHAWAASEGINFNDMHYQKRAYKAGAAYSQSKLANLLFAKHLAKRLAGSHVTAFSLHPGTIMTNLARHLPIARLQWFKRLLYWLTTLLWFIPELKTIQRGAATTVYVATAPGLEAHSGGYFSNCREATPSKNGRNAELASKLWASTEEQLAAVLRKLK
ncbi:hypothetical protein WJX74_004878 [Apatococcus lobatus]|uniref:Uncharacterized protein n=1 Tax=Apatococcus lobatus TaxID=904363 RepID=A0AAW1RBQ9_9CHLO